MTSPAPFSQWRAFRLSSPRLRRPNFEQPLAARRTASSTTPLHGMRACRRCRTGAMRWRLTYTIARPHRYRTLGIKRHRFVFVHWVEKGKALELPAVLRVVKEHGL